MDELLTETNNRSFVKGDSRSLTRYTTTISVFIRDMEDNWCSVQGTSEAPFLMSKLYCQSLNQGITVNSAEKCKGRRRKKIFPTLSIGFIAKQACDHVAEKKATKVVLLQKGVSVTKVQTILVKL